jgi:predicted aspartyl protease
VSQADAMSLYYVDLVAINSKREELRTEPVRVLVDTGAECSWLPAPVLAKIGIQPRRKRAFRSAEGRIMVRDVGYCILAAEGFETNDEIVFAQPGDMLLLGVRTLEGFCVTVDPVGHRLTERPSIVAGNVSGGRRAAELVRQHPSPLRQHPKGPIAVFP